MGNSARADVFNLPSGQTSLQFVTVGDPGNAPDTTGFGAVPYTYQMGKYDITVAQYTQMLNSVAQTDPDGLYNFSMNPNNSPASCGIIQSGNSGNFAYTFAAGHANLPVNSVSFADAIRFCNWLTNGQPATGVENASTTESGSYTLGQGATTLTRSPSALYVIPTVNEWYKAAYYKSDSTNAGYWLFPTRSNTAPSNVLSMTGTNNANYFDPILGPSNPPDEITDVGYFAGSPGPYGTFDQGGDVFQLLDNSPLGPEIRGGGFGSGSDGMESSTSFSAGTDPAPNIGFRVVEVPEPSSIGLLIIGAYGLLRRRRAWASLGWRS